MQKLLSKKVFKQSIKNNWKLWIILTAMMCFMLAIIMVVYQSRDTSDIMSMKMNIMSLLPMMFGSMFTMYAVIYLVATGNKLVASEVDKGTMSFTLNTPTTRLQIILSKALFYICSIIVTATLLGTLGTIISAAIGLDLNLTIFWNLVFGFMLYTFAVGGICFFASCWFNKSSQSIALSAGFSIAFILLNTFSGMLSELEFLKYFSLNTLYDTNAIVAGGEFVIQFIVLLAIGVATFCVGIHKFTKKDLPL